MIIQLENEMAKLPKLKESIEEIRVSLWQWSFRKRDSRVRFQNAGKWFLGRYKKSRRSYKGK